MRSKANIGVVVTLIFVAAMSVAAHRSNINDPSKDEAKWIGTYYEAKDKMTLTLQADHKGTMSADGKPGDITWTIAGDDKITLGDYGNFVRTADGNLRDDDGNTWTKK